MKPNMTSVCIFEDRRLLTVHGIKDDLLQVHGPGGKFKPRDISLIRCAKRELREELGIGITIVGELGDYGTTTPEGDFLVRMYRAIITAGRPEVQPAERKKLRGPYWRTYEELTGRWNVALVPNLRIALPDMREAGYL